jgi:hypothetical protein
MKLDPSKNDLHDDQTVVDSEVVEMEVDDGNLIPFKN